MRNRYAGICYRCGVKVEPYDGHFEKVKGTKNTWRTQHASCAIEYRNKRYEELKQQGL